MGIRSTSYRLIATAVLWSMLLGSTAYAAALRTLDDGAFQSYCKQYDFLNATVLNTGQNCTVDASGGGAGAPADATYITQTPNGTLAAEQAMSVLGTGLTINTTTTGVQSIYAGDSCTNQFPRALNASGAFTCETIADADVPNSITIDLATAATGLAADPTDCGANTFAQSIVASGNLTCAAIADADVPNDITIDLATAATALAANPTDCAGGEFANAIAANGDLTCATPAETEAVTHDVNQTTHGFSVSDWLKITGTNTYALAQADSAANAEVVGVVSAVTDVDNFTIQTAGRMTGHTPAFLLIGEAHFLNAASAGDLTSTAPSGAGEIVKPVIIPDTSSSGFLFNMRGAEVGTNTPESTTAGRSLTLTTFDVAADAELFTDSKGAWLDVPIVEEVDEIYFFMNASTITRVHCWTDVGTVTLNIENAADADVLSADLVCDAGGQSACASGCDVDTIQGANDNFAAFAEGDISISAVATSPGKVSVFIGYTKDD